MVASDKKRAPAFQLSFLLLLQQLAAHRAHDLKSFGKMLSTLVRRLISLSSRSSGLVLHTLRQCSLRKWRKASTSSLAAAITGTAVGNCLRSILVTRCKCERTYSGAWMTNSAFIAAARLEPVGQEAAVPEFWDSQADVAHLGGEKPLAVAVAVSGALIRAAFIAWLQWQRSPRLPAGPGGPGARFQGSGRQRWSPP